MTLPPPAPAARPRVLWECFTASLHLGLTSFGGPVAHLGYFQQAYVERRRWLTAETYAGIVALCHALPGPASSQANFLINWRHGGFAGAALAWLGFTLPSAALMFAAALALDRLAARPFLFHGLELAAAVVIAQAVGQMAPRLCPDLRRIVLALGVAVAALLFGGVFVQLGVILLGAAYGALFCQRAAAPAVAETGGGVSGALALRCLFAALLLLPALPLAAAAVDGNGSLALADVFYRTGALVFGGGHVVLPLLYESLGPALGDADFMALYGAAQALPGPLFAVAAGFGAAALPDMPFLGAGVALGFIFLPGLLLAVAGMHYWQRLASRPQSAGALAGINAAVVGLLAAALVHPVLTSAWEGWTDTIVLVTGFALLARYRLPPVLIVLLCLAYAAVAGAW